MILINYKKIKSSVYIEPFITSKNEIIMDQREGNPPSFIDWNIETNKYILFKNILFKIYNY